MIALSPVSRQHTLWLVYLIGLLLYLYRTVRRNQKDRVLLCEALGVTIFLIALILYSLFELPDWLVFAAGFTAVSFGVLALYFVLLNWAERRVKRSKIMSRIRILPENVANKIALEKAFQEAGALAPAYEHEDTGL